MADIFQIIIDFLQTRRRGAGEFPRGSATREETYFVPCSHGRRSRSAACGRYSEAEEEKATSNKVALQATTVAPIAFLAR